MDIFLMEVKLNKRLARIIQKHPRLDGRKLPAQQRVYMVAILKKGGSVFAIGFNDHFRKSFRWKRENRFKLEQGIHAEIDALNKHRGPIRGAVLEVIGVTTGGNVILNTYPCASCMSAIRARGIKKLRYMKNGVLVTERL
jgi:deoxycytidylate deaminase